MADAAGSSQTPSMRVLVVDDEVNLRFAIERRLRKAGMEAVSASTVRQAVERLRSDAFDVVLCDLHMPGGDGTQLLQWLGSYSPSTRVVVVSAFVTPEFRAEYASDSLKILEKPVDLDVLIQALDELGPRTGFFGNAIEVELFDYVQMIALCGRDKLIEVKTARGRGLIWFEHGDIVHAEWGDFRGELAFYKMLAVDRGIFKEMLYRAAPLQTVTRSSTHLLMEAARQADEGTLGDTGPAPAASDSDDETSFADVADETSFADVADDDDDTPVAATSAADMVAAEVVAALEDDEGSDKPLVDDDLIGDDFVLPADDDEDALPPIADGVPADVPVMGSAEISSDGWDDVLTDEGPTKPLAPPAPPTPSAASSDAPASASESSSGWGQHSVIDNDERRAGLLRQFRAVDGVNGVAIISNTGKVLADDMADSSSIVTLAGFYMRGAARIARTLGYNVFDGVIARAESGQQMVMVTMGPTSAVMSVEIGEDPEAVRTAAMEAN